MWLADYIERMGVRVCSCCGNGLLFVKGYIPGIWCACAVIDKNPACRDWWTDWGFWPGQAAPGREKELGGRCVNRRTERWSNGRTEGGKEEGDGDVSSAAADAMEPGGGVSAVGRRKRECALRLPPPYLGYFLNVTHFTIKVSYVSVCVLIMCSPWQDIALQCMTKRCKQSKGFVKALLIFPTLLFAFMKAHLNFHCSQILHT